MALDVPTTSDTVRPAVPLAPAPRVPMHTTDDAVIHPDVKQSARPSTAVAVAFIGPNDMPVSVKLTTMDGTLYGDAAVTTGPATPVIAEVEMLGCNPRIRCESLKCLLCLASSCAPSKLNTALDVPTTSLTMTPAVPDTSEPRVPMHTTDVVAIQLDVAQSASASRPVAVPSVSPNPKPARVTLPTTDAALYGAKAVSTGADQEASARNWW